jgi:transposase, IS5 family
MSVKTLQLQDKMFETNIEELVRADYPFRKILKLLDFNKLCEGIEEECYSRFGSAGYHPVQGVKMLFLQYWHDLSDRELEDYLKDSCAGKYFCGFSLLEETPDHTYFTKFRKRIGTKRIADIFNAIREGLKKSGYMREIFTFVDSSKIEAKVDTWRARDKAIVDGSNDEKDDDGNPTMNNKNLSDYSTDPDARYGAKSKNDIWIGYKRHASVDMGSGFINKVAVTPANVHDGTGLKHVCPSSGAVVADKAYSGGKASQELTRRGLHSMAIEPNNKKTKNHDKDRFISSLRMPFEGVFSRKSKRARFIGKVKTQFQAFMEALIFNTRRALILEIEKIPVT